MTPEGPLITNPPGERPDPLELLLRQEEGRLQRLLPVRHSRMAQSPLSFFRGGAAIMAADLARQPRSDQIVQLCGDAHLLNFGFAASPERHLLFDLNDFDETHPGPYEWDVLRLAASLVLAARHLGLSAGKQEKVCRRGLRAYARAMAEFASLPMLPMWGLRLDLDQLIQRSISTNLRRHLDDVVEVARRRDSRRAVRRLCESDGRGGLRFRHAPPLIWRFEELEGQWQGRISWQAWVDEAHQRYLRSIRPEVRRLLANFRLCDVAIKAAGVGSVGMRCAIGVFVGDHPDDVLVLQSKQAEPSVLAPWLETAAPRHQGERVVRGQRLLQTVSDPFLGWTTCPAGHHHHWRHFRDWKAAVTLECLDTDGLSDYGRLCGWTLAKGHARSGDRRAIAAHVGASRHFAAAMLAPAVVHADQAESDHRRLLEGIATGVISSSASC